MSRILELFMNKWPYTDFHELNADWLISAYKILIEEVDRLDVWKEEHEKEYEELKEFMDAVISGNFPEAMIDSMYEWLQKNAYDIIGSMIKHVYFGLTNDGYFCAFIPDNWSDIQFDTITDFDDPLYGHLVLMYD